MMMLAVQIPLASIPTSFTADLTTSANAIDGGVNDGGYPKSQAFDNSNSTSWTCSLVSAVPSDARIGQDFGVGNAKRIRKLTVMNSTHGGLSAPYWYDTMKLRYSDDGTTWSDALEWYTGSAILNKTQDSTTKDEWVFRDHGSHRYWIVEGQGGAGGTNGCYGGLGEIEMMEAA